MVCDQTAEQDRALKPGERHGEEMENLQMSLHQVARPRQEVHVADEERQAAERQLTVDGETPS